MKTICISQRLLARQLQHQTNAHLRSMIMWPLLDTGLFFSTYAVTFSSFHMIGVCAAVGVPEGPGNVGTRGDESGVGLGVAVTMLHIGHPDRGANGFADEAIVRVRGGSRCAHHNPIISINKRFSGTATSLGGRIECGEVVGGYECGGPVVGLWRCASVAMLVDAVIRIHVAISVTSSQPPWPTSLIPSLITIMTWTSRLGLFGSL